MRGFLWFAALIGILWLIGAVMSLCSREQPKPTDKTREAT
jgi:hypothetical protein